MTEDSEMVWLKSVLSLGAVRRGHTRALGFEPVASFC
jgi:hypothetical protein